MRNGMIHPLPKRESEQKTRKRAKDAKLAYNRRTRTVEPTGRAHMLDNPFTPSFGRIPPFMAGRKILIQDMISALEGNGNDPLLQSVIVGARGTGKTALLTLIAELASERGWVCANTSCIPGMLEDIVEQVKSNGSQLLEPPTGTRLKALTIGQLVGAEWERAAEPKGNWRTQMNALLDELAEKGAGLLITVDEVSAQQEEMIQLASVYQHFIRERRRVALVVAGLPHHVSQLVDDELISFLRRASRIELDRIEDFEIEDALVRTVEEGGKAIADDALETCVEAIDGFPYMMQLVGFRSWDASGNSQAITAEDASKGAAIAQRDLERQILVPTWANLSPGDREFCRVLAQGNRTAIDIAKAMDKKPNYVSKYKQRLLEHGVIEADAYSALSFSLPGFEEFVKRQ